MSITQNISSLPTAPTREDPATFDSRADAFLTALENLAAELQTWTDQANLTEATMNNIESACEDLKLATELLKTDTEGINAETKSIRDTAEQHKIDAKTYADAAAATGNYKGQWSSVTTYSKGDIVSDTDHYLYMSLVDNNLNNFTDLKDYWLRLVQYRYEHTQTVPAEIWKITHNLNRADIPILKILVNEGTGSYFVYTVYSGSGNYCGDFSYCGEGYSAVYTKYTEKNYSEARKITDNELHIVFSAPETGIAEILI